MNALSNVVRTVDRPSVDRAVTRGRDWLLERQDAAGFWCAELEGDTTLESYLVLLDTFVQRGDPEKLRNLSATIRQEALHDGGWSQYPGGPPEISVSCLSYFALKVAGDGADLPHMRAARTAIVRMGGIERANTYTKYHLALFGQLPWRDVPAIPPEMMFLPRLSPFTVYDMSAWSRTIFVPLSILYAHKPVCTLPSSRGVAELFAGAAPGGGPARPRASLKTLFFALDQVLKVSEKAPGAGLARRAAISRAGQWMIERLEDSDGLSAILPAMANSAMALKCLGYGLEDPLMKEQLAHIDALLLRSDDGSLRMQPCVSPVWDTVLASHALAQSGAPADHPALRRAATWLLGKQCRRSGDWAHRNDAAPGGWYFEHRNEFYPDVDDTCMALMVLRQARSDEPEATQQAAIERGLSWMLGMQNSDGGWGSFDRDNDKQWLTQVPFADHNAMIDPSTADITARVLECLALFPRFNLGHPHHPVVQRALDFLRRDQASDGCWYGRWGVNYLYGTWQVLRGLRCIGEDMQSPVVRRAVRWLINHQNADGGWGESIASYDDVTRRGVGPSTPSQTAWGLMGLLAAGEVDSPAVSRAARHLVTSQDPDGTWQQEWWTGTGFPKVFYLNYHYYRHTFPLMALGQYRATRWV